MVTLGRCWRVTDWSTPESDEDGINATGAVAYRISGGAKGCWRTPNGDGWPDDPPEVEFGKVHWVNLSVTVGELTIDVPLDNLSPDERQCLADACFARVDHDALTEKILVEAATFC